MFAPDERTPASGVLFSTVTVATTAAIPVDGNPACPFTVNVAYVFGVSVPVNPPVPIRVSTSRVCNGTNCPPVPVGAAAAGVAEMTTPSTANATAVVNDTTNATARRARLRTRDM